MDRAAHLDRIVDRQKPWDVVVIGGGATGVGIAVDAAARNLDVALIERGDFGQGTSSRSTKLIHGGVRYLKQGQFGLVREALAERGLLTVNAPHLVHPLRFLIPHTRWFDRILYGSGLWLYDRLARADRRWRSGVLPLGELRQVAPTLQLRGVRSASTYYDCQFDDARLLILLARTAASIGATLVNYVAASGFEKDAGGRITAVVATDRERGGELRLPARCVVNAAGPFCDQVRQLDDAEVQRMIQPSQGVHLVVARRFLPGTDAVIVPRTRDGRVLFAIPWQRHTLIGTTDTPLDDALAEPLPTAAEIDFLLETAAEVLRPAPTRRDILSLFVGIRPLARPQGSDRKTAAISREHVIQTASSGLINIAGGKWTTYRRMAEDTVDRVLSQLNEPPRACRTASLPIVGREDAAERASLSQQENLASTPLSTSFALTAADVVWAVRTEMARTVEDVLARRTRILQLDLAAARRLAPVVAGLMAEEMNRDAAWQQQQCQALEQLIDPLGALLQSP